AEQTPDIAALKAPGRSPLSYAQLLSQIETVRESLNAFGVGRNDRIVVVLNNGPEMAAAFMAIASCSTAVPLNPAYRADEFNLYLSRLNAKAIVVAAEDETGVQDIAARAGVGVVEVVPQSNAGAGSFAVEGS